jgi:hypothetical protein
VFTKVFLAPRTLLCGLVSAAACSGNGSAASVPSNAVTISVNAGPAVGYANGLFASITVCVPGSTDCQRIDSVLVDTGSIGLRVLASGAGGELSLALPLQTDSSGSPLVECNAFVDSYTWGPVRIADIAMGGEKARSVPIQVIGDPSFGDVPTSCSATGGTSADTLQSLGAYAILGVGPFPQDCGASCAEAPSAPNTENPGYVYYACPASGCQPAAVTVEAQVQNPVSLLPVDNNGVMVDLPSVPMGGAPTVTGSLVFGIGTQPNNDLGGATVLPIDPETLTFTTIYRGQSFAMSFVDSGSNAIYFLDSNAANLPACTNALYNSYYCPDNSVSLTATNRGTSGVTSTVSFAVANAGVLFANQNNFAFNDLAGPSGSSEYFDWGLSFFYGRKVFSAIEGAAAPGGQSPYFAY